MERIENTTPWEVVANGICVSGSRFVDAVIHYTLVGYDIRRHYTGEVELDELEAYEPGTDHIVPLSDGELGVLCADAMERLHDDFSQWCDAALDYDELMYAGEV